MLDNSLKTGLESTKRDESLTNIPDPVSVPKEVKLNLGQSVKETDEKPVLIKGSRRSIRKRDNLFAYGAKKILIDSDILEIEDDAFRNIHALEEVILPEGLGRIGPHAFEGCSNLRKIDIPSSVIRLETCAFKNCKKLSSVNLREGNLHSIYRSAFFGCESLESISIPESVGFIDTAAFGNCTNLSRVDNLEKPGRVFEDAFIGCEKLQGLNKIDCKHIGISDDQFVYNVDLGRKESLVLNNSEKLPLFSQGGPKMDDVKQGYIGDCWLLASLASIAHMRPDAIKNIMKDNENGTVDVTFQRELIDGVFKREVYTVKKSLLQLQTKRLFGVKKTNIMSQSRENIWVQMIEKAFSAYLSNGESIVNYGCISGDGEEDTFDKDEVSKTEVLFKAILGKEANKIYEWSPRYDEETKILVEKIKKSLDNKIPLYYAIRDNYILKDIDGYRVVNHHAFSLIGLKEDNGKYYVELRNPWGYNYKDYNKSKGKKDAIITVDLKEALHIPCRISNLKDN